MRTKYVLLLAAIIAIAFALPARAELPIVQVDTIFAGFGGGSVSGIVFGPTGETVIVMHDAQPVEINIKTKQVVREFEKVQNALIEGRGLFIVQEKGWICCNIQSSELNGIKGFYGLVIWDYNTGKIINTKEPAITSNGKQFYTQLRNNDLQKQYFCRYDINNLRVIDSVEFDQGIYHGQQTKFTAGFGIIPNSNKLIIGTNTHYEKESGLSQLYVLDFETKLYTKIQIPYKDGTKSSNISNIKVSETGKYFCVDMSTNLNDDTLNGTMFFNNEFKYLFTETGRNIKVKIGDGSKDYYFVHPCFFNDDYLIAVISEKYLSEPNISTIYNGLYEINGKSLLKRINFDEWRNICYNDKDIVICNYYGTVILLNIFDLSVNDDKSIITQNEAGFINGILTFNSASVDKADINIIDYHGNTVFAIKDKYLQSGRNSIAIDFPLANGVYFAIVKTAHGNFSYKFIINR